MYSNWAPQDKFPVYFHCRLLSDMSFTGAYDRLADNLFIVIFQMIYEIDPPCMTNQVKESLHDIVDWFSTLEVTYI